MNEKLKALFKKLLGMKDEEIEALEKELGEETQDKEEEEKGEQEQEDKGGEKEEKEKDKEEEKEEEGTEKTGNEEQKDDVDLQLREEIENLKNELSTVKKEYAEYKQGVVLESALTGAKVLDKEVALKLLKEEIGEGVEITSELVTEKLASLKANKGYLFKAQEHEEGFNPKGHSEDETIGYDLGKSIKYELEKQQNIE